MSKNQNSKKTTWEKLNTQANQETMANESAVKESTPPEDKSKVPSNQLTPSYETLEAQLQETKLELAEDKKQLLHYKEQVTYRLAETENVRRRCKLDIENDRKFFLQEFMQALLPVKDNLEAALLTQVVEAENDPTLEGVQLTLQELQKVLEKNGLKTIDPALGENFDAHYHQAMLTEENDQQMPNTILKVLQKGYLLHERLLRPARVVVAKASEKNS